DAPSDNTSTRAVKVWRVANGATGQELMLSPEIIGLATHWVNKRSEHCQQEDCPANWHRTKSYWRGYTAILGWNHLVKLWMPYVLEVTPNLELDLRGVYRRGQVWEIARPPVRGTKKYPVVGRLLEERS